MTTWRSRPPVDLTKLQAHWLLLAAVGVTMAVLMLAGWLAGAAARLA